MLSSGDIPFWSIGSILRDRRIAPGRIGAIPFSIVVRRASSRCGDFNGILGESAHRALLMFAAGLGLGGLLVDDPLEVMYSLVNRHTAFRACAPVTFSIGFPGVKNMGRLFGHRFAAFAFRPVALSIMLHNGKVMGSLCSGDVAAVALHPMAFSIVL